MATTSRFARELTPGQRRITPGSVGADLLILAWFVFSLFPLVWMVLLALKSDAEQTSTYFAFSPTLTNFGTVLSQRGTDLTSVDFGPPCSPACSTAAGRSWSPWSSASPRRTRPGAGSSAGSEDLMFQMLSFRFAPELMVIVPLFVIYNQPGLFDTTLGMVWVLQLVTMPLVVWILRSYFQDLAPELEQAALLDGYTRTRAFVTVALPLVRPGIAAAALLAFIFAWNNYVFPLILTDTEATTVTVAVTKFLGGGGQAYYNLTAAAALIGALPPLVLALTIQRYLVRGLSFGAVKA